MGRMKVVWTSLVVLVMASAAQAASPEDGFVLAQWGDWSLQDGMSQVAEAQRVGARHVAIVVVFCQTSQRASDPHWCDAAGQTFEATALGAKVALLAADIRARGMSFSLIPILTAPDQPVRQWFQPDDRAAWFRAYGDRMVELADFSREQGATSFVVGSELTLLFLDAAGWRQVISRVRPHFGGHLTISAVFATYPLIGFWDALDSIGISAYFPLTVDDRLSAQWLLDSAWLAHRAHLETFAALHGKPLTFVEVGYPTTDVAASRPWDYEWGKRSWNAELPRRCWEAFRNAWSGSTSLRAFQIWALSNPALERGNVKDFTPLHKPSEEVVARVFSERAR